MKASIYKTCESIGCKLEFIGSLDFEKRNTDVVEEYDKSSDIEQRLINIHPDVEYHTFYGFGGAFTETAAISWSKLPKEKRKEFITAYFDPEKGIGYTAGRLHINSCDFSAEGYTYVKEWDMTLDSFNISHDTRAIIPMIKAAGEVAELWLFASPWSPPVYMKNTDKIQGGHLKREFYPLWADYIRRYILAYREQGIKISAVTVQNEPRHHQQWESCLYTPSEESDYIGYLSDALKGLDVKIICYDHCRERLVERAGAIFGGKNGTFCDGIANHWYSGDHFGEIRAVSQLWGDKLQIASESCCFDKQKGIKTENIWHFAEKYAHDISGAISAGINYYCDWNLTTDENNGPTHFRERRNIVEVPIYCDTAAGELVYQPSYYYIGHYSKFIRPGAKCVANSCYTDRLEVCTFKNTDGSLVCVVLNRTEDDLSFILRIGDDILKLKAESHSVQSIIIKY